MKLPRLRAGCASDTGLTLEYSFADSQIMEWHATAPDSTQQESWTVPGLVPGHAYVFRASARNAHGSSGPSLTSAATFSAGVSTVLNIPPIVEALSSSSYRVSWLATSGLPCGLSALWRLEYRRATDGAHAWHALIDNSALREFEPQLRCPKGCMFRVTATNLAGWKSPSTASEPVPTRQLHPPAHGAVRLELHVASEGESPSKDQVGEEITRALGVSSERVRCVEIRDAAQAGLRALVFDLLPASHAHVIAPAKAKASTEGSQLWSEPNEETMKMAQDLALQLLATDSTLRKVPLFTPFSTDVGLMQLTEEGEAMRIGAWVPPPAMPPPPPSLSQGVMLSRVFWLFALALLTCIRLRFCLGPSRGYKTVDVQSSDHHGLLDGACEDLEMFDDCGHLQAIRTAPAASPLVDILDYSILDDVAPSQFQTSRALADANERWAGTNSLLVARVTTHENGAGCGLYVCDIEFFDNNRATLILLRSVQNPSSSLA